MRPSGRQPNQLRDINFHCNYSKHAEGSVLVSFGDTRVLCNATIDDGVPRFLKGAGKGWVTAEYGMLPRSTHERMGREASRGKQGGRTLEIQRLIGRSLRAAVDLEKLGERSIIIDCDVLQADGGTRTAAITGSYAALSIAISKLIKAESLLENPILNQIASVSVGMFQSTAILDLDYAEDSQAETDMNVVMNNNGDFVEIQGTAENQAFSKDELNVMLDLAEEGIKQLFEKQNNALSACIF